MALYYLKIGAAVVEIWIGGGTCESGVRSFTSETALISHLKREIGSGFSGAYVIRSANHSLPTPRPTQAPGRPAPSPIPVPYPSLARTADRAKALDRSLRVSGLVPATAPPAKLQQSYGDEPGVGKGVGTAPATGHATDVPQHKPGRLNALERKRSTQQKPQGQQIAPSQTRVIIMC